MQLLRTRTFFYVTMIPLSLLRNLTMVYSISGIYSLRSHSYNYLQNILCNCVSPIQDQVKDHVLQLSRFSFVFQKLLSALFFFHDCVFESLNQHQSNIIATRSTWLLSICYVTSATEELNFKFYLLLINLNYHMWLMAILLYTAG